MLKDSCRSSINSLMPLNTILRESLRRLQRSGESSIFLSDKSIAEINALKNTAPKSPSSTAPKENKVSAAPEAAQAEVLAESPASSIDAEVKKTSRSNPIKNLPLKGSKETQMGALKESIRALYPQDNLILGCGTLEAKLVFITELPSADEITQNKLFVGEPGALLDKILIAMGLSRSEIYSTALFKSTELAAGNPEMSADSSETSIEYLKKELQIIDPSVTVLLGTSTFSQLMPSSGVDQTFAESRGKVLSYENFKIIPSFHPAYLLLKNCLDTKRLFWEDMMLVMEKLDLEISDQQKAYFINKK